MEKSKTKNKNKIKIIEKKIRDNIEGIHYNLKSSAPWYKYYGNLPKKLDYPDYTLFEFIESTAKMYPKNYAYEYYGTKCFFEDFIGKIKRCAKSFQAIGVTDKDAVTICMPNTPETIIAFYAVNLIGAIANMVHPLSSEKELAFYLNKADSKYIVTMDFIYEKLKLISKEVKLKKIILCKANDSMNAVTSFAYWVKSGRKIKVTNKTEQVLMWKDFYYLGRNVSDFKRSKKTKDDLAVILYSGGTTGNPKGIMLSSHNFNAIALQNRAVCPSAVAGNSILSILPTFHGFGLGICFHTVLSAGMKSIIIPKFTQQEFSKLIKTYKPNFIAGVPTLYEALINSDLKDTNLDFINTVLCGGDILTPTLRKNVNAYLKEHGSNAEIMLGYGLTECVASIIATPLIEFVNGTIGIPVPDMFVKIVKINTTENLYYNEDGEICVSGPAVMLGYLKDKEETKNTLKKHDDGKIWLHTGDIGSMDKNGMIFFKTRLKRIIISAGYNIYPTYIENIINEHPKVLTSIVVGLPDSYKGEVAKAFIVLKSPYKEDEKLVEEIKNYCKKNIAKYSLPVTYEFRDSLPKTLINKIDYRKLQRENID